MLKYENPATKTEAAKAKRRKAAHGYFDKYFINDGKQPEEATKKTKKVVTTAPKVYVWHGNGKNFKEA